MPKTQIGTPGDLKDRITLPRDGEAIDAGDVNAPMTDLLNNDLSLFGLISALSRKIETLELRQGGVTLTAPSVLRLEPARNYTFTDAIGVGRVDGYAQNVTLSALDVPAGVTVTFAPAPLGPADTVASMSVAVTGGAVAGTYNLTLVAAGADGRSARALLPIVVAAQTQPSTFTFGTAATGSIDRASGESSAAFGIQVSRQGSFADPVTFSVPNLPAGMTATWSANPVTGADAVQVAATTLTITAAGSVPAGTYNLTVRAESANTVRTQGVALSIGSAPALGEASYTLDVVYDAGDPLVVNGATVYINRTGGYTGPVQLYVGATGGSGAGPVILINGQPWTASVSGNTARITADGLSRGWQGSGVAPLDNSYSGSATFGLVRGEALINNTLVNRFAGLTYRWGTRLYGLSSTDLVVS